MRIVAHHFLSHSHIYLRRLRARACYISICFSPKTLIPSYPFTPSFTPSLAISSMAEPDLAAIPTLPVEDVVANEDDKFGFKRSEMYKETLAGTVDRYDRHVFLCYKNPEAWLPRVEDSETDPLPKLLASSIRARKSEFTVKTKVTICESREGTGFEEGDVLIFPDLIKYKGLKDSDVDSFVDDVLVNGKPWASGPQEILTGSHIFVCAHGSRDKRCGVCGPVLMEKLNEGIDSRGLKDQVVVSACSHIGGHKYAGNVIAYRLDSDGKVTGHWFGYVTPEDVPEILDQHIGKGEVIERLWRGQLGESVEVESFPEQKVPNGEAAKEAKKLEEKTSEVKKDSFVGCCQEGVNGVSCCREVSEESKNENPGKKRCGGKVSSWVGSLDQSNVLAGVAVVGAVATIAVAYSFYRRSG
ncbi:Altered inheritance of mitochondria protein 32 [Linum grandiflorum]